MSDGNDYKEVETSHNELEAFRKKYEVTWLAEIKQTVAFTVGLIALCGALFLALYFTRDLTMNKGLINRFHIIFQNSISETTCESNLKELTETPHLAGTEEGIEMGRKLDAKLRKLLGEKHVTVYNQTYEVLLPFPTEESYLTFRHPTEGSHTAKLYENPIKPTAHEGVYKFWNQSFLAYSASGSELQKNLFYVNYGTVEDFDRLRARGIDLTGKVVIARYGKIFRGQKVKTAQERGCVAVIIYSDPQEDGANVGPVFPEGPWRPADALQRGSTMFLDTQPGDPTTPGHPSLPGTRHRISRENANNIPKIPVVAISANDGQAILKNLDGDEVEESWRGGFGGDFKYRYGTDANAWKIDVNVKMNEQLKIISNIFAKIEGAVEPDRKVMLGNHRDPWVYGATDPHSGTIVLLEVAKGLGSLLTAGWQPRRTILLALWDAEEQGLIGSTEYVEQYREQLKKNLVTYINVDTYQGDVFRAMGSSSIANVLREVSSHVASANGNGSALDSWKAGSEEDPVPTLVGSGSDYTAFYHHIGIPIIDLSYRQKGGRMYGAYHSIHDNFDYFSEHIDKGFKTCKSLSTLTGRLLLRFSDDILLPFGIEEQAVNINKEVKTLKESKLLGDALISFTEEQRRNVNETLVVLQRSVDEFISAGEHATKDFQTTRSLDQQSLHYETRVRSYNDRVAFAERGFVSAGGLKGRSWYKHVISAPAKDKGYSFEVFPGVREALREPTQTRYQSTINALSDLSESIDVATSMVTGSFSKRNTVHEN